MTFAAPWALALLPLAALLVLREWGAARAPSPALLVADLAPLRQAARRTWRVQLRRLPLLLRGLAIVLVAVALAQPRAGLAVTALPEEGIDVVVTVDVSSSMTANVPGTSGTTRLAAAQAVVSDFVDTLEGDRIGLVIFQARALTLSPLTNDADAIHARVRGLAPGLLPDGTAIGLGLAEATALLQDSPAKSRIVVLLTDGQNNAGEIRPLDAARVAQALGVRVYTIGFLGPEAGGVDRQMLRSMAESTGGRSYDARTQSDLAAAYAEVSSLERSRVGEREFTSFVEYGPWIAAAAVALLTLEAALRATWLRSQP